MTNSISAVDRESLLAVLDMAAVSRGTHTQRLAKMQRIMLASPEAMAECTLPNGAKRVALTTAMLAAQTVKGRARCIICAEQIARESNGEPLASGHPAMPNLITLLPSILWSDDDVAGWDKDTAHRLGMVAGNVALACSDCAVWKTQNVRSESAVMFTVDVLGDMAPMVLLSWEGIGTERRRDSEPKAWSESRARRALAREARLSGK